MTHNKPNRRFVLGGLAAGLSLSACQKPNARLDTDILILGAGLSGLYAANMLADEGYDVTVLEGSERIGGRLKTLDIGTYGFSEGGGEQVGASYARIRHMADKHGVALEDSKGPPPETSFFIDRQLMHAKDWADYSGNPYSGRLRAMAPGSALFGLAAPANPLPDIFSWKDSAYSEYDIAAKTWLQNKGLDDRALELIDHGLNGNSLDTYSMMNLFRTLANYAQDRSMGRTSYIKHGAQALPEAMAVALSGRVHTGQMVQAITDQGEFVTVQTSQKTWKAKRIISTLPLPVLRKIKIGANLLEQQKTAIAETPYTQILQVHFRTNTPFWEKDGFAASMWTDGPFERFFARQGADGKPDGVFRSWVNGTNATRLNEMTDDEIAFHLKTELKTLRPMSKGDVEVFEIVRWADTNPVAGGAYMHFAPGQVSSLAGAFENPAGRLYFAGEHCSDLHTGMEGAMESAEKAVVKILDA